MKNNYRATKPVYNLKPGTEILSELRGYYARIDGWQGSYYYATELLPPIDENGNETGGDMMEGEALRITPHDLVGCEIFEEE